MKSLAIIFQYLGIVFVSACLGLLVIHILEVQHQKRLDKYCKEQVSLGLIEYQCRDYWNQCPMYYDDCTNQAKYEWVRIGENSWEARRVP